MLSQKTSTHPVMVGAEDGGSTSTEPSGDLLSAERYGVTGRTNPQLVDSLFGLFANVPAFDRVMRQIEEDRAREREEAERADSL